MDLGEIEQQPYPVALGEQPRGRSSSIRTIALPDKWLDDPDEYAQIEVEDLVSGG